MPWQPTLPCRQVVANKNVPGHCQMSPGGWNCPWLRNTNLKTDCADFILLSNKIVSILNFNLCYIYIFGFGATFVSLCYHVLVTFKSISLASFSLWIPRPLFTNILRWVCSKSDLLSSFPKQLLLLVSQVRTLPVIHLPGFSCSLSTSPMKLTS